MLNEFVKIIKNGIGEENGVFTHLFVGCKQHRCQLSFVAELRDKDGPEDC